MNTISLRRLKREYKEARRVCEGYPSLSKHWDKKLKDLNNENHNRFMQDDQIL